MLCRTALLLLAASVDARRPARAAREPPPPRCGTAALFAAAPAQYSGAASGLFNNMKTPASILAGALIGTGFLSPLPKAKKGEHNAVRTMRKLHLVVAAMSFCSELLSVMWATVAVNKLTETVVAPSSSAFALLKRDFELPCACHQRALCARHVRVYGDDRPPRLPALAEPVRRGGGGLGDERARADGGYSQSWRRERGRRRQQLGLSVWALIARYAVLLTKQATSLASFGFLELTAIALAARRSAPPPRPR